MATKYEKTAEISRRHYLGVKESGRFLKRRCKNFWLNLGPWRCYPARSKLTKFFATFCLQKVAFLFLYPPSGVGRLLAPFLPHCPVGRLKVPGENVGRRIKAKPPSAGAASAAGPPDEADRRPVRWRFAHIHPPMQRPVRACRWRAESSSVWRDTARLPGRVTTGTPIQSASQLVGRPRTGTGRARCRHRHIRPACRGAAMAGAASAAPARCRARRKRRTGSAAPRYRPETTI